MKTDKEIFIKWHADNFPYLKSDYEFAIKNRAVLEKLFSFQSYKLSVRWNEFIQELKKAIKEVMITWSKL